MTKGADPGDEPGQEGRNRGGLALFGGLLLAALAQFLSALLVGPEGTGWSHPVAFSPALFIVYPVVFTRLLAPAGRRRLFIDMALLATGVALDVLLAQLTVSDENSRVRGLSDMPFLGYLWITFWLSWQVLLANAVYRDLSRTSR